MNTVIEPGKLSGCAEAMLSKSDLHRLLICAALADAPTTIHLPSANVRVSDDIIATVNCLKSMGTDIDFNQADGSFSVRPCRRFTQNAVLDCNESGSTFRFLLPVAAAVCENPSFSGKGRLPERPISDLLAALNTGGVTASSEKLPFSLSGKLQSGCYTLPGNVSSQYITGLLLALPALEGRSEIRLTTPLESASYVNITLAALAHFGINIEVDTGFTIPENSRYISPGNITADSDWSNGAFFLCAGAICGESDKGQEKADSEKDGKLRIQGLNLKSPQGDKAVIDILKKFGANVDVGDVITVSRPAEGLHACDVDLTDIPDLLPILAVVASNASGTTTFYGGKRLRLKESDRLSSVCKMMNDLGGMCEETEDGLKITGTALKGGTVDSFNDHRIVMAASIAALNCEKPVTVLGAQAVNKSYPTFFEEFKRLGGKCHDI